MSNDKILIDRDIAQRAMNHLTVEWYWVVASMLRNALATSPAVQEGNASAYLNPRVVELEQKWEALYDACLAKDRRITELAAELLALKQQQPWQRRISHEY